MHLPEIVQCTRHTRVNKINIFNNFFRYSIVIKSDLRIKKNRLSGELILLFKGFYLFILRQRESVGEKHQCVVSSHVPPTGDLARNPGMCPEWESPGDPLVDRLAFNPLTHTARAGRELILKKATQP